MEQRRRRRLACSLLCVLAMLGSTAHAALTDSEKGQIRSYIDSGNLGTVSRLRGLIARPDLSDIEMTGALSAALRPRPFRKIDEEFLDALLFGPASQASRSTIMPSVVDALLSRADAVLVQQPGDPMGGDGEAGEELLRIHRFVEGLLAQALASEAKGVAGLQPDARRLIAMAYGEHIGRHRTWLGFGGRVQGRTLLLRAQVALVLSAASKDVVESEETARVLGLGPAAQGLFLRSGALLDDGGLGPEIRRKEVVAMLEAVPGGVEGVDLVLVSKVSRRGFSPHGRVMYVRTPLGPVAPRREDLWPRSVRTADPESAAFETAWVASSRAVRRRLSDDTDLANRVREAIEHATGKGAFATLAPWVVARSLDRDANRFEVTLTPADFLAAATTLLLLDVERTVDLASMRSLSGHAESFEQLLLGLEALAGKGADGGRKLILGKVSDRGIEPIEAELLAAEGRVVGVSFDGHRYEATFGKDGRIADVLRDGATYELGDLAAIDVPTTRADRWQVGTTTMVRLHGRPQMAALGRRRFVLEAGSGKGTEGIYTEAPSADQRISCRVRLDAASEAGVVGRASTGSPTFHGVGVVIACPDRCSARLVQWDGQTAQDLGETATLPAQPADGFTVTLEVDAKQVQARIADATLRARLQTAPPPGHVGWIVRPGARISVRDWTIEEASSTGKP